MILDPVQVMMHETIQVRREISRPSRTAGLRTTRHIHIEKPDLFPHLLRLQFFPEFFPGDGRTCWPILILNHPKTLRGLLPSILAPCNPAKQPQCPINEMTGHPTHAQIFHALKYHSVSLLARDILHPIAIVVNHRGIAILCPWWE